MKKAKSPEQIVSKNNLYQLYIIEDKTVLEIANLLNMCRDVVVRCLKYYNIEKPKRRNNLEQLKQIIKIEEFINYYNTHNIYDTAHKYNTLTTTITQFCDYINFEKSKESIKNTKIKALKNSDKLQINKLLKIIDSKELENLYVVKGYTYDEVAKVYNTSRDLIIKVIKYYGLKKNRSDIIKKTLDNKYKEFGSHEEYHKHQIEKRILTWENKYGSFENYLDQRQEKIQNTNINKYGFPTVMGNKKIRAKQARSAAKSSLEKRVMEFLTQNNFNFISSYTIQKDNLIHAFDIAIFKDNNLEMLIDCDGVYYHGYLNDKQSYPDEYRSSLVPEGVKFITVVEKDEENAYKDILKLYDISYDDYIQEIFNWCREVSFPYPIYDEKVLKNSFKDLNKATIEKFKSNSRIGDKILYYFHPSIWHCHRGRKLSPYEAWQKDNLLLKCIKNRLIYIGNNLDRSKVLSGFTISGIAPKISVFNPYLAKYIIEKYLNNYEEIFDPCSGYSGRMLGACVLGKKYIGQDINPVTVAESNRIIKYFDLNAEVNLKNSLKSKGEYKCLFTCPPYGDKENWNQDIKVFNCDEWIDFILNNYKCETYIFVVDETTKYKNYIIEELSNNSHFSSNKEYIIKIDKSILK